MSGIFLVGAAVLVLCAVIANHGDPPKDFPGKEEHWSLVCCGIAIFAIIAAYAAGRWL